MHKLAVFATAGRAYRFLFGEIGTILRLSWCALVVVSIIIYFTERALFDTFLSLAPSGGAKSGAYLWILALQLFTWLVTTAGMAVVAVALHRVILFDDRKPGVFIHFAFGKVELLFVLIPLIASVCFLFLWAFVLVPSSFVGSRWFNVLILAGMVVSFVYIAVRLSLMFPIAVVERRFDIRQAWRITLGNFWRLFALWLVVMLPIYAAWIVVGLLMVPFLPWMKPQGGTAANMLPSMLSFMLNLHLVMQFLWSIVTGTLGVAVLSYSYKALNGRGPDEVLSPQTPSAAATPS